MFTRASSSSSPSGADAAADLSGFSLGQHVYVQGTGKWWTGSHFGAVIVDLREADGTIKVRYTDGGFKRFKADTFRSLVTDQAAPEMWEEWYSDAGTSDVGANSDLQRLHDDVMLATRKKEHERATLLKKQFLDISSKRDELTALRYRLIDAINRGDYLEAHAAHTEIKAKANGHPQVFSLPPQISKGATEGLAPPPSWKEALQEDPWAEAKENLARTAQRALGGGIAGASAMVLQVCTLMPLRTTMNYQYRYGISAFEALSVLWAQNGIRRFYQGIGPALIQGPMSRFGDTAANAGVLAFFDTTSAKDWPLWVKTIFASSAAASMRIALVPIDTVKTIMQVEGKDGVPKLMAKWRIGGAPVMFHGAVAASAATFISHYPWFAVFNTLNDRMPMYDERHKQLLRNAGIGFCASVCSDTVSNSLRVMKTCRQVSLDLNYAEIARKVVKNDGLVSLFFRGLPTRLAANGISGVFFSVLYRGFEEHMQVR